MKPITLVCLLLVIAAGWSLSSPGSCAEPIAADRPADGPVSTAQASASPAFGTPPVQRSSADPIVGTWRWKGENNTVVVFSFKADGTFQRQDDGTGMGATTGTWKNEGGGSYRLVYDNPGYIPEHVIYHPSARQPGNRSNYFSRA